jgi:hypothetical protein
MILGWYFYGVCRLHVNLTAHGTGLLYRRKNAQVVTDLQTSCNKVVVKPISGCVRTASSSCCDKSGTSCYHLVTRLMTATDLLQVVPTSLIQAVRNKLLRVCCHQLVTCRRCQTCWNKFAASLLASSTLLQDDDNLFQTCQQLGTSSARTHHVDKL